MNKILPLIIASVILQSYSSFSQESAGPNMISTTEIQNNNQYKNTSGADNQAPWFVRKYEAQLGFFMPFSNTNISIGGDNGILGTDIDMEKDLGLKPYTFSAYTAFGWHISKRSKLSLSYFYIGRSATHTLERDIEFKDTTFHAYASVSSFFNTHIGRVAYSYAVLSKPNYEVGLIIGSHIVSSNIRVELNTTVGNLNYKTQTNFTAPLPDIGVFAGWAINDKLAINGEFSYLPVTVSTVSLKILSYNLALQYQAIKDLSFSLSYTGLDFKVNIDGDPLNGYVKWGYHGPTLMATYRFGRGF